jgi:hypothetical protein
VKVALAIPAPWELIKEFEVSAEHIAQKAIELLALAKAKLAQEQERNWRTKKLLALSL